MASGIVAERRRAPSGDIKAALLAALFAAIPHRALMRYGKHSCKKLKKAPKGEPMAEIVPCTDEFEEYLRDESRSVGSAGSIVFPESEADVCDALHALHATGVPVTVQGARSGLAAGAVPHGGCVLNTSRMNRVLGMRRGSDGRFFVRVQPGLSLMELRDMLQKASFDTAGWSDESLAALVQFKAAPAQFFAPDPTEASAALGGIVACNASGSRSYAYGAARPHVEAMRVALADGDVLALRRGEVFATGRELRLVTEGGRELVLNLPTYDMPKAKNASGYFACDDMDAIDLFIGACGTLGVICELELALLPVPVEVWGASCFFPGEAEAVDFTIAVRGALEHATAIEYFDGAALDVLRAQKVNNPAFAELPELADDARTCVFVELSCDDEETAEAELMVLCEQLEACGGDAEGAWVATTEAERAGQRFFRHAVPESVNMLIDQRRRTDPSITKLGSDMSVPDDCLRDVIAMYRRTLAEGGFESATWGHIGSNHVHVNILPRSAEEYARGAELFARWAAEVSAMGGAVSAEHGVGKLKAHFLEEMYGANHIAESARMKAQIDPKGQLGRGNLFSEEVLDAALAELG